MMDTWRGLLEHLVMLCGSARDLARAIEIDESKLSRWRRYAESFPNASEAIRIAEVAKCPLERVLLLIARAEDAWLETRALRKIEPARPQTGTAAPPVVPSPGPAPVFDVRRGRPRRRRIRIVIAALTWLGLGGWAEASPYPWVFTFGPSLLSDMLRKWCGGPRPCAA